MNNALFPLAQGGPRPNKKPGREGPGLGDCSEAGSYRQPSSLLAAFSTVKGPSFSVAASTYSLFTS